MKSLALLCAGVLSLAGCANLTPAQQTNLQNELALGKMVVQATSQIYCVWEPVTTKLIGIFDTSKGTTSMITKIDAATVLLCQKAIGATP